MATKILHATRPAAWLLVLAVVAWPTQAQPGGAPANLTTRPAGQGFGVPLTLQRPEVRAIHAGALRVASPDFLAGGALAAIHSAYADNVSPALTWQPVRGAASYLLVVEDPDSTPGPTVHWVVYDLPASATGLPRGVPVRPRLADPHGVSQGTNTHGTAGYSGPHPPVGDPPHHYHFQVLALDVLLRLAPGASRDEVLEAARGHVIATGELVGTYQQLQDPPK